MKKEKNNPVVEVAFLLVFVGLVIVARQISASSTVKKELLEAKDFHSKVNGEVVEELRLKFGSSARFPIRLSGDIAILIDTSGSMAARIRDIEVMLAHLIANCQEVDSIGLVPFSGSFPEAPEWFDLKSEIQLPFKKLIERQKMAENLGFGEEQSKRVAATEQLDALFAIREITKSIPQSGTSLNDVLAKHHASASTVIVISDGLDTSSKSEFKLPTEACVNAICITQAAKSEEEKAGVEALNLASANGWLLLFPKLQCSDGNLSLFECLDDPSKSNAKVNRVRKSKPRTAETSPIVNTEKEQNDEK